MLNELRAMLNPILHPLKGPWWTELRRRWNDDDESARRLAAWVGDLRHVVNVIPFNEWEGAPYREPSAERVARFCKVLHENGCLAKIRRSRGRDVRAACGTLAV